MGRANGDLPKKPTESNSGSLPSRPNHCHLNASPLSLPGPSRSPKLRYTLTPRPVQNFLLTRLPKRLVDRLLARTLGLAAPTTPWPKGRPPRRTCGAFIQVTREPATVTGRRRRCRRGETRGLCYKGLNRGDIWRGAPGRLRPRGASWRRWRCRHCRRARGDRDASSPPAHETWQRW
jgi:hypothetical protein